MLNIVHVLVKFVASGVIKKAIGGRKSLETAYFGTDHIFPISFINISDENHCFCPPLTHKGARLLQVRPQIQHVLLMPLRPRGSCAI
jgi:hypothetical protein